MAFNHSPRIVTDGLVLCLDAANPASYPGSGTTWNDLSGNSNTGTLTNGPTFTTDGLGAIVFDGADDSVVVDNSSTLQITNSITINLWVNVQVAASTTGGCGVVTKGTFAGEPTNDYDYMMYITDASTAFAFYKKNSAGVSQNLAVSYNSALKWSFLTVTLNDTDAKLYTNSQLALTSTFTSGIRSSNDNLLIGKGWNARLNGFISGVQIYNRALSADEVLQNFNATKTRFGL
jgi:hypothetical protein